MYISLYRRRDYVTIVAAEYCVRASYNYEYNVIKGHEKRIEWHIEKLASATHFVV